MIVDPNRTWGSGVIYSAAEMDALAVQVASDPSYLSREHARLLMLRQLCPDPDIAHMRKPVVERCFRDHGNVLTCGTCGLPESAHGQKESNGGERGKRTHVPGDSRGA